ncbi:MAG: hypothetical protein HY744_01830 [Deltaproteobacteria bacterium]|nr:hypothetical protein [Deltaproteobacteria bacterium]
MPLNWFVALPVPTHGWFDKLVVDAPAGVRIFDPRDVHLTVAFLGQVGEPRARQAWARVMGVRAAPIRCGLGGLRAMGNPRRPSALSVVLEEGHARVVALVAELRGPVLEAAGAPPERREIVAHVTVARPSRTAKDRERRAAVAWATAKPAVGALVTIERIALYSWAEDRAARQFRIVDELPLRE